MKYQGFMIQKLNFFEFSNDKMKVENIKEIFMLSEKAMCDSCKGVAQQFIKNYLNVKVGNINEIRIL